MQTTRRNFLRTLITAAAASLLPAPARAAPKSKPGSGSGTYSNTYSNTY